jgi:hypothetical protein
MESRVGVNPPTPRLRGTGPSRLSGAIAPVLLDALLLRKRLVRVGCGGMPPRQLAHDRTEGAASVGHGASDRLVDKTSSSYFSQCPPDRLKHCRYVSNVEAYLVYQTVIL